MKAALAFGFGYESCRLLDQFKDFKPTVVTVIGPDDDCDEKAVQWIAERFGLPWFVVHRKDKGYSDAIDLNTVCPGAFKYENCLIPHLKKRGLDTLITGRRRIDFINRSVGEEQEAMKLLPTDVEIFKLVDGVKVLFPAWNWT
jgi:hypothetical protein